MSLVRTITEPRHEWERKVEDLGLIFHHTDDGVYWDESVYYALTPSQVNALERATNELHQMCLAAAQAVIDQKRYREFGIPEFAVPAIEQAWESEPPAIYGRFDLAYDGSGPPKLLEYNADTPTGLVEAAVAQWYWKEDCFPGDDQFNSIHERLVAKWRELGGYLAGGCLHFAAVADQQAEDLMTVSYLRETAIQAGLDTVALTMADIGWDDELRAFVDLDGREMRSVFKLYPWEWLIHEDFGHRALSSRVQWIEPAWKMLLSNKAILPVLWEMYPHHEYLVPAYFHKPATLASYVRKPKLSREGANVAVVENGAVRHETGGDYGEEGFIIQQFVQPANAFSPVFGSWVIDGVASGVGIREGGLITDNKSRFVPHVIR